MEEASKIYEAMLASRKSPLLMIQVLYFKRRTGGVAAARNFFAQIRPHCTEDVFAAAAALEHDANGASDCAVNVFEMGIRKFEKSATYVLKYVEYLRRDSDSSADDVRAVFERSLRAIDAAQSPSSAPTPTCSGLRTSLSRRRLDAPAKIFWLHCATWSTG